MTDHRSYIVYNVLSAIWHRAREAKYHPSSSTTARTPPRDYHCGAGKGPKDYKGEKNLGGSALPASPRHPRVGARPVRGSLPQAGADTN